MIDWARAVVTVKVPVIHTATEEVQEVEVPLAFLLWDDDMRAKGIARLLRAFGGRGVRRATEMETTDDKCRCVTADDLGVSPELAHPDMIAHRDPECPTHGGGREGQPVKTRAEFPVKPKPNVFMCGSCDGRGWRFWKGDARWVFCGNCHGVGWLIRPDHR